jgi:hypothetical protein
VIGDIVLRATTYVSTPRHDLRVFREGHSILISAAQIIEIKKKPETEVAESEAEVKTDEAGEKASGSVQD